MDEQKCSTKSPPRAKVRDLADEKKNKLVSLLMDKEEFKALDSFRLQCHYLFTESKKVDHANRLSHEDISVLYDVKPKDVTYHICQAKR